MKNEMNWKILNHPNNHVRTLCYVFFYMIMATIINLYKLNLIELGLSFPFSQCATSGFLA